MRDGNFDPYKTDKVMSARLEKEEYAVIPGFTALCRTELSILFQGRFRYYRLYRGKGCSCGGL